MEASLSEKVAETAKQATEMARLRQQLMNKDSGDIDLKEQLKELQEKLEKEIENLNQYRELKEKMSE